jgi:glycosyltransferase involved in cell wall biosynthesis
MINVVGPINQLGYGITSLNLVKSLAKKTPVCLWVIGQPQVTNQSDAELISTCLQNRNYLDFDAPCIKIWHQNDMTQFAGKGKRIGFPIFELDEFNELEKHHLNSLDSIFVCSNWAKNVVLNNINISPDNVYVIPLGVDQKIFKIDETKQQNDKTIFLNCGKWEVRKGHDILYKIFNMAFEKSDNVELWMLCENPFLKPNEQQEWIDLYLNSKLGDKIKIIPRQQTQQEVYNIMRNADCGVFPSRAEGWNLELLEMMVSGKSVITTNYSAHTEFCTRSNARLVDIQDVELAYDGKWFHGKCGNWAKIDDQAIEQFVNHLREVHTLKQSNSLVLDNSSLKNIEYFNWDNSADLVIKYV